MGWHHQSIFEITEVIRPRVVLTANFPSGLNLLLAISYHTERQAFQATARLRLPTWN
jgi:hypothetical protein